MIFRPLLLFSNTRVPLVDVALTLWTGERLGGISRNTEVLKRQPDLIQQAAIVPQQIGHLVTEGQMKKTLKKAKAQPSRLSVLIATLSAYFQRSPAALTMLLAASGVFTGDMMCNVADGTPLDGSSLLLLIFLAGFEGLAIMIHAHEHPAHVKVSIIFSMSLGRGARHQSDHQLREA